MLFMALAYAAHAAEIDHVRVVPGRPSTGVVEGTVARPVDEVLARITDCAGTAAWFPDMLDSRLVWSAAEWSTQVRLGDGAARVDFP